MNPSNHPSTDLPTRRVAARAGVLGSAALGAATLVGALLTAPAVASPLDAQGNPGSGSTVPATVSAPLARTLGTAPASGHVRVLVTLRARADLSGLPAQARDRRLAAVVQRLREHASTSQAPLRARLHALAAAGEVGAETPLWVTDAVAVTASPAAVRELAARPDVASVTPDAITVTPVAAPAEPNLTAVGAPSMWAAGQTGQGVVVATLDSGVDTSNADLASRWRGGTNSWFDPYGQHATPVDLSGHGTATTGLVVGGDGAGTSYGMAPGASWIAARVFDDRGAASATAIHQAFQWVLDPDHDPSTADAPRVVNASWVLGAGPGCDLSFQPDVRALRAAGIVPVFAAGNFGASASTSASPANYPESLSVGAVSATDTIWSGSSSGPSTCGGRTRVFPDVVAPGVSVLVADRYDTYTYASGTSVAAPHVTGALALLLGAHPDLAASTLEQGLVATAHDLGTAGADDRYGAGRVDVPAADAWAATVPAPTPDLALAVSPGSASTRAGGAVTFGVTATPAGGFASATSLSVTGLPTGATGTFSPVALGPGAWSSTLSVTTGAGVVPGSYPLTVTAAGGGLARTATMTLVVTAVPDFTLSASPTSRTVKRGQTASYPLTIGASGGFTGKVTLSRSFLPAGATSSWTVNPVAAPGTSRLDIRPSSTTRRGTYTVTVTGTGGGATHSVTLTLVVT
ncbi:S8 family serine peptidase [Intrasporangium sp. YIM S08009]|uniref:S8 family serine peptidase n=1 Tax=Intrasporangium zincisolvens TaxID=3080018 RepID=UPI002B056508|nr:S8 family serine peptidase [Intrasporangium sp. YIM S08009]